MQEKFLSRHAKALLLICLAFLCIHGGLFLFDLGHPDAILRGDRAETRLKMVLGLMSAEPADLPDLIFHSSLGAPGDFLQHALLYWIGGPYLVIAFQIALQLLILVMTYFAAMRLTGNAAVAAAAGLFLLVMPGTLMNPHLFTSETWFAAFMTAGVLLIYRSLDPINQAIAPGYYYAGFVSLALACFVRSQGLLVSAATVICLCAWLKRDYGKIIAGGLLSYLIFPVAWMTLRFIVVGEFGIGESDASLVNNLALREDRILGLPFGTHYKSTLAEFLQVAAAHPLATLNTIYSDALNLVFNPGATHVFGYYLGLFTVEFSFWQQVRDQHGLLGVVTELLRRDSSFLALFVAWTVIHFTILLATAIAVFRVMRDGRQVPVWVHISLVVSTLVVATAFAAGMVRWDHRAGIEPLLALLAAYGLFGGKKREFSSRAVFDKPHAFTAGGR